MSRGMDILNGVLSQPITHYVITTYKSGSEKILGVRSANAAETHAIGERRKIGKILIDRYTKEPVEVVSVTIKSA